MTEPVSSGAPEHEGRRPDFVIIGASKAGTTSLYQHLQRHPGLFLSTPKEPHFFSREHVYERGLSWYRSLFAHASPDQRCGEASTTYSWWPHGPDVPSRMYEIAPEVRLVYVLRHPVDRAYSHYAMESHALRQSFEERLARDDLYVDIGMYRQQIERYLALFPASSLHVLLFEDLIARPATTLATVQRFLAVPERDLSPDEPVWANPSDRRARDRTAERLRAVPGVARIGSLLPKGARARVLSSVRSSPVGRRIEREYRPSPLTPDTRRMLLRRFERPNRELEELLGRELPGWFE